MFVCLCGAVSEITIRDAIRAGAATVDAVGEECTAGTYCGKCQSMIEFMIEIEMQKLVGPDGSDTHRGAGNE